MDVFNSQNILLLEHNAYIWLHLANIILVLSDSYYYCTLLCDTVQQSVFTNVGPQGYELYEVFSSTALSYVMDTQI